MALRVVMVCVGNICRSPMAEGLLREWALAQGLELEVSSAGLAAVVGEAAHPEAKRLLAARGFDISKHRARQLTADMIASASLVIVMELAQVKLVESMFPPGRGRVHRLGRFGKFDVADPFGGGAHEFSQALARIERGLLDYEKIFRSR